VATRHFYVEIAHLCNHWCGIQLCPFCLSIVKYPNQ